MSYALTNAVAYSLDALSQIPAAPIVAKRAPTVADKAPIGTLWIYSLLGESFILVEVANNQAEWLNLTNGAGNFATLFVTGNATILGNSTTLGRVEGTTITATGDLGGVALTTSFTDVTDVVQGAGVLTILSSTANAGDNAGFLKFYVGATVVWVPYFTVIAP
jgi:hypothetical protein